MTTGATIDDLANILTQVRFALTGDDEATVIGQIRLARQDSNDKLDSLRTDLKNFMEEMAASSTEALIQALEEVIKDFNAKINEQFGDNFKQLNNAVGKILEWQERYRQQLAEMIAQQSESSQNMRTASQGFKTVMQQAGQFERVAASLGNLLNALNTERGQIQELTSQLSTALSKCKTAIPEMESKVVNLAQVLDNAVRQSNETAIRALGTANTEINQHIKSISEKTQQQVSELDSALSEQLTQSLEMFGRQLAALSEKFVADYTPLTERLRSVLAIAGGAAR